jgi:chromosome segregation ATPase
MPPKTKGGKKKSAEEERLRAEQERLAEIRLKQEQLEKEAEDFQRRENEERDAAEYRERKRLKKEAQQKLLSEKDASIASLSAQLSALQSAFSAERSELEDDALRKHQLCDSLQNEMSAQRSEFDETLQRLLTDRDDLSTRCQRLEKELEHAQNSSQTLARECSDAETRATTSIGKLQQELDKTIQAKNNSDRDMSYRINSLEREVEKLTSVNKTLQEVIEARESDDRKNVTLMQLLNNQLDENKRRNQELIDEERLRCNKLQKDIAALEAANRQVTEDKTALEAELQRSREQNEREVAEFKAKVDQLKFDSKYLAAELQQYKNQLAQAQQESTSVKSDAANEIQDARLTLEAQTKKVEELEALIRRKDRDNFDKVTFLNAQVSNNRTIINQLQQRLSKEREERVTEISAVSTELDRKSNVVQQMYNDIEKRKVATGEVETKLNSDIAILKTTVFQLQAALVDRERELESVAAAKDEEVRRLRAKLDEHFIPHRNEIEGTDDSRPTEKDMQDKVVKLQRDLEAKSRASLEGEARLKSQIANQNSIIESLQSEQRNSTEEYESAQRELQQELSRLRTTLDVHNISYRK